MAKGTAKMTNDDDKVIKPYFSHEIDASEDPKCSSLITDLGMEGWGFYWEIVSYMHKIGGYISKNPKEFKRQISVIAKRCCSTAAATLQQITALLDEYELLKQDETFIWSDRILYNLNELKRMKKQKAEAGKKGGEKTAFKRDTQHRCSSAAAVLERCSSTAQAPLKQNQANKRKLKEIKLNKRIPLETQKKLSKLTDNFFEHVKKMLPTIKTDDKELWEFDFFNLFLNDKRSIDEIEVVVDFIKNNDFWSKTVLSTKSLKQNFDQLVLKAADQKIPFKKKQTEKPILGDCIKNIVSYTNGSMGCELKNNPASKNCPHAWTGDCLDIKAITEVKARKGR